MPFFGCLVGKPSVLETKFGSASLRREFDRHYGFGSMGAWQSGHPCHFHQTITLQPEKPSVMWMALPLIMSFEKENGTHLSLHQDYAGSGKPSVELFCPGTK